VLKHGGPTGVRAVDCGGMIIDAAPAHWLDTSRNGQLVPVIPT
jgi:hypothetical protein